MEYTLKEIYDWLDLINEKLEEAQEKFERFTNAKANIWLRHELTKYERSETAAFQDWILCRLKGRIAFLIQTQISVNLMIAEVEDKEKNEIELVTNEFNDAKTCDVRYLQKGRSLFLLRIRITSSMRNHIGKNNTGKISNRLKC